MRKTFFWALPFVLIFPISTASAAREQVRDYERLRLLQQATGETPAGNSSFETRVNALLDPGTVAASPAYTYQADKDEAALQQVNLAQQKVNAAEAARIYSSSAALTPNDNAVKKPDSRLPVFKDDMRDQTQVDATEAAFQKKLDEIANEPLLKKKEEPAKAPSAETEQPKQPNGNPLDPALANNPFYFPGAASAARDKAEFEANKPVLVARLVQEGFTRAQAEKMLNEATSSEDLVLSLMSEGKTYGEANDLARTK